MHACGKGISQHCTQRSLRSPECEGVEIHRSAEANIFCLHYRNGSTLKIQFRGKAKVRVCERVELMPKTYDPIFKVVYESLSFSFFLFVANYQNVYEWQLVWVTAVGILIALPKPRPPFGIVCALCSCKYLKIPLNSHLRCEDLLMFVDFTHLSVSIRLLFKLLHK